jgi:hypothetical protein
MSGPEPLKPFQPLPLRPAGPRFPIPSDADGLAFFGLEIFETMFRRVRVHRWLPTVETQADNVYLEDLKGTWPADLAYDMPAFIAELPGWKAKLTKQGVDEERDLTIAFNQQLILAANQPYPTEGDLIEIFTGGDPRSVKRPDGGALTDPQNLGTSDFYKVHATNPADLFANLSIDRTYTWVCLVKRHRYESVSRGDVDQAQPPSLERESYP